MGKKLSNTENFKKIILIGLENSGKTSISLSLTGKKGLQSFLELKPTKGVKTVNFEALDTNFVIWDLGGQEKFREHYIQDHKKIFAGTSKIIYVIDIQDQNKYILALEYLKKIIGLIKKDLENVEFNVFLHKYDPDLDITHPDLNPKQINELITKINAVIPEDLPFKISKSSIYAVFEKSDL